MAGRAVEPGRRLRDRPVVVAIVGIAAVVLINAVLITIDPDINRAVPLLLLFVPVTAAAVVGGWRGSVPVAVFSGLLYGFAFLAPRGEVRIGLTEDTVTTVTFVVVALAVSVLASAAGRAERQRDEQRAVLLRSVSHDLRNPLSTIRAAALELRDNQVTERASLEELLDLIVAEAERLDRIVGNLLSLSRIESGNLAPDRQPEELGAIVRRAVERLGDDDRIVVCLPPGLPAVEVDRTQIDQALTNLVENGLRHGGAPVTISAVAAADTVEVRVTDRGEGFRPAVKERASEFFSREGLTSGEGVGLAVAKVIVEAHGGTLRIGDQPGGGACVSFTIPQA